jgi:hypothetical protein
MTAWMSEHTGADMGELTRWSLKVSKDTDISLRTWLAEHGGKKGDLSKFIERAVNSELLRKTMREVQDRNAHVPDELLEAEIEQACKEARAEVLGGRKWWSE